jgi:hypothetical protein
MERANQQCRLKSANSEKSPDGHPVLAVPQLPNLLFGCPDTGRLGAVAACYRSGNYCSWCLGTCHNCCSCRSLAQKVAQPDFVRMPRHAATAPSRARAQRPRRQLRRRRCIGRRIASLHFQSSQPSEHHRKNDKNRNSGHQAGRNAHRWWISGR